MSKGSYVILQGGSPIEKVNKHEFYLGHYLEPRVFTKGRCIKAYFL